MPALNPRPPYPGRRTFLGALVATAAAPGLGALPAGAAAATPSTRRPVAAGTKALAPSGAWCWFGDPRAVHHRGTHRRTYVGYITAAGDINVTQYDHDTGGSTTSTLISGFQIDDHNNPSIIIRHGRVVVFFSGHGGDKMYYRRSVAAEDISQGWEPLKTVPTNIAGGWGYTYPNPVELAAEGKKLYLFWRGGNANPTYSTTTGGDVWTPAQSLVDVPGQRPYVKIASNDTDTIHFAFTDGHPRNVDTGIYYMYYRNGSLFRADGSRIGPLGTPVTPDQTTCVYDFASGGGKAWIHDIADDGDGRPVLTYAVFPTDTDHRYHYARFDGSAFTDYELTAAGDSISEDTSEPNYSGGITLDHDDPSVVLLSREIGKVNEIERWTTPDHGATWRKKAITAGSGEPQVRPVSPRGLPSGEPLGVLWMAGRYPSYTTYQTRIMATT
ncbi:hypothetical protein DMB38_30925 [Streptomyces sp. WAC 06738]|uniref:BNR-4 repeat-containing protein n=1 Tax=Streptomyces sp. WAC 06738 TaxID=2203210 RepID=UPI000F6B58D4|nr:BNR-4 repeat-containing protein [Streptomyces sp. WAC 06738]AZM49603.1 hypothetical protein DMB38_30925 [Streptomyces sp. WAC 06738]